MESKNSRKEFLYRGCSVEYYEKNKWSLIPKEKRSFASCMCDGLEYAQDGRGLVDGVSVLNEIVRHEYKQKANLTSGISTTPHIERAIFYATNGGEYKSGYIYKINRRLLQKYCVSEYEVVDLIPCPSVPEDDEVILVGHDFGKLPDEIVVSVFFLKEDDLLQMERETD